MKIRKNHQKSQFHYLEKGALKICLATPTKPIQIEPSGLFLLVSGPLDVRVRRKPNSAMFYPYHETYVPTTEILRVNIFCPPPLLF